MADTVEMLHYSRSHAGACRLGEVLVGQGLVARDELSYLLEKQHESGKLLGEFLVEKGRLNEDQVAAALAEQYDVPYIELEPEFLLSADEVRLVPEALVRRHVVIPTHRTNDPVVTLIVSDPLDIDAEDAVQALTGMEVRKAISTRSRILAVIDRCYRADAHIESDLQDIVETERIEEPTLTDVVDDDQLRVLANDAPVVKFVNLLLLQAVRDRASDIHFEPGERTVTVRLRVDGSLRVVTPPSKAMYQAVVTRIKILAGLDIAERRLPMDGRFKFRVEGRSIDIRVSTLPEVFGEKIVLRLLDSASLRVDMNSIGFDDAHLDTFRRVLQSPNGIVLLTGPTGSGKTTTLYSALAYLRSPERNIQTVEDPVEYVLPGINQMHVLPRIGLDFAGALRSILRQDPDIIMVGEIRDEETARIAMRAALTGHLVLSTLHTNDAPSAFCRLRDIGIEPYLIVATVKLVIAQRLVRRICQECAQDVLQDAAARATLSTLGLAPDAVQLREGVGCEACEHTGFLGREAILEFMEVSDPVRDMVTGGIGEAEFRQRAKEMGMQGLVDHGLEKMQAGITTLGEVLRVAPVE